MAKGKYMDWLEPDRLLCLEAWARDGLTDEKIAEKMGICTATLYNWKNDHLPILDALKRGKEPVDIEVENALLKRALGYTHTIVKPFMYKGEILIAEFVEEVAPDVTAQIFWLKNRKAEQWRDRRDIETFAGEKDDNRLFEAIQSSALEVWDNVQAVQQQTDEDNDLVDASSSE